MRRSVPFGGKGFFCHARAAMAAFTLHFRVAATVAGMMA
jgi:hypothetical protein